MMLFAAHILDPRYKTHQLEMIIPDQYSEIIAKVKKYFKPEWPELATLNATSPTPSQSRPVERPQGVSIALWKAIQIKKRKRRIPARRSILRSLNSGLQLREQSSTSLLQSIQTSYGVSGKDDS
jgi:hypothetical protein